MKSWIEKLSRIARVEKEFEKTDRVFPLAGERRRKDRIKKDSFIRMMIVPLMAFATISVSYAVNSVESRISSSRDDAEEFLNNGGRMYCTSSDLELVYEPSHGKQIVGMRFNNITIPKGATITRAYLEFTVDEESNTTTNVLISGQAADNASSFSCTPVISNGNISNRAKTSAQVSWSIPPWTHVGDHGADQTSPDLSPVIQEIVDRSGWSSGNSLVLLVEAGTGCSGSDCHRVAKSYNGSSAEAPLLHIEYTDYECAEPKEFDIIYQTNAKGNIALIGNTNICKPQNNNPATGVCVDPHNAANNSINAMWKDGDSNGATVNSSSAKLILPPGSEVLWAGLYWQGYFQNSSLDSLQRSSRTIKLGYTQQGGAAMTVPYRTIRADRLNHVYFSSSRWYYQGFADVTDFVRQNKSGWYWGADLNTSLGRPIGGTLGAWSIAVVYTDANESIRNLTIFDGYLAMAGTGDQNNAKSYAIAHGCDTTKTGVKGVTEMTLSGFKTPVTGNVDSRLIFFGGEGDIRLSGDNLWLAKKDGTYVQIKNSTNPLNNIANSSITDYNVHRDASVLYPRYGYNTIGIDIDTFDVSNIIENDQRTTKAKMNTVGDGYFPGIFGFSTELYEPNVCYDYVVKRNGLVLPDQNMTYESRIRDHDEISFTVAIWDITGDIPLKYVSVGLPISQSDDEIVSLTNKAYYTQKNSNAMLPTNLAAMSSPNRPVITIGEGRTDDVGGTVDRDERYFMKFFFEARDPDQNNKIKGTFDIEVNATLNYGSGDFSRLLDAHRCPQNPVYQPTWYHFNVEKRFTGRIPGRATKRYSLPTRIAARDFDYSIASYVKDSNGKYTVDHEANGVTVDVELVDIGAFDDNGSYFKCSNPEPSIIMMPGKFSYFDNNKTRINVDDPNDLTSTYAVRNATFRMWLLIDQNGTIITSANSHPKSDNSYFEGVYNNYFKAQDPKNLCLNACTSPYSYNSPRQQYDSSATGCYACLRDYFAQPYCARDNFAIRPRAIRVEVNDKGADANLSAVKIAENINTAPANPVDLSAGYPYRMTLIAENNDGNKTKGYYSAWFHAQSDLTDDPANDRNTSAAILEFDDSASCADKTHRTYKAIFYNGEATNEELTHNNAGKYKFMIWDSDWTKVDHAFDNPNKTVFVNRCRNSADPLCNDCTIESTTDEEDSQQKVGCLFGSNLELRSGSENPNYMTMYLRFHPYSFDLSSMTLHTNPTDGKEWVYMSDLNKSKSAAVTLEGNITAVGADGAILSNYIVNCAANDVNLSLIYRTRPDPVQDEDNNTVAFEQMLTDIFGDGPVKNADENMTFPKGNFTNTGEVNGSAAVKIYYNFKKNYNKTINIADVNFSEIKACGKNDISIADQKNDHMAEGNMTINENKYFYFAKVMPQTGTDGHVEYGTSFDTTFWVDVYCKNTIDIVCNSSWPGLYTSNADDTVSNGGGAWYRVSGHTPANDGKILSLTSVSINSSDPVLLSPNSNIEFDNNGSTSPVTISYPPTSYRPQEAIITITPDEWLKYHPTKPDGLPDFTIYFRNRGLLWKGEGKTGHVIESSPAPNNQLERINW